LPSIAFLACAGSASYLAWLIMNREGGDVHRRVDVVLGDAVDLELVRSSSTGR